MDDEHPILRSLLDSLNAMNQRLNVIENVLSVSSESAQPSTASQNSSGGHPQVLPDPRPNPTRFSTTSTPSKRPAPPLQPPGARLKTEDDNSDEDVNANDSRLAPSRGAEGRFGQDDGDDEDDEDDGDGDDGDMNGEGGSSTLPKELQPTGVSHSRLEALPEGFVVSGRATLQEELDSWTIPRGYSMRINGTRSHGRRQKIRMVCFRGGRSRLRPKEEEAKRKRERERLVLFPDLPPRRRKPTTDRISKKCECPFRFELVEVCPGADRYAVHYTNDDHTQHNHAAADLMLDPRARKLPRALKAEVDQWLRDASTLGGNGRSSDASNTGWTIAKIQAELQRRGYGHVLDFDLRNRKRALLHKDRIAQLKKDGGEGGGAAAAAGAESSAGGDTPGTAVS
ncbi:hypothetical protein SCUCBS95973_001166 [Sporothrix curviconia]|uniref:Transcription factor n=1 Tax=Sporothrix curviconia TaxID=1260050 RepID=A0ABP0AWR4_9PEZI